MRDAKELGRCANEFIKYLTDLCANAVEAYGLEAVIEAISGLEKQLPLGFVNYLDKVVLGPAQRISELASESEALAACIQSMRKPEKPLSTKQESIKEDFLRALGRLRRQYQAFVPAPVRRAKTRRGKEIGKEEALQHAIVIFDGMLEARQKGQARKYKRAIDAYTFPKKVKLWTSDAEESAKMGVLVAAKKAYTCFFKVLEVLSAHFYRERTKASFIEVFCKLVHGYDNFFGKLNGSLLNWLRTKFGYFGAHMEGFQHSVEVVGSLVSDIAKQAAHSEEKMSQEQLFLLGKIGDFLYKVDEKAAHIEKGVGLFYVFYAALFPALMRAKQVRHSEQLSKDAETVSQYMNRRRRQGVSVIYGEEFSSKPVIEKSIERDVTFEVKVKKIDRVITALNQSRSDSFRKAVIALVVLSFTVIGLVGWLFFPALRRRHREIVRARESHWERSKAEVKAGVGSSPEDIRERAEEDNQQFSDLHTKMSSGPYAQHRFAFLSKSPTRSQQVIQRTFFAVRA